MMKIENGVNLSLSELSLNKKTDDIVAFKKDLWECAGSDIAVYVLTENDIGKCEMYADKYLELSEQGKLNFYEYTDPQNGDLTKGALIESYTLEAQPKPYPYDAEGNFDPSMLD